MKRIRHGAQARDKLLHIEGDGCVINVRVGLTDNQGRRMTSVQVIPDAEENGGDHEGRTWTVDGALNTRIIRDHEKVRA